MMVKEHRLNPIIMYVCYIVCAYTCTCVCERESACICGKERERGSYTCICICYNVHTFLYMYIGDSKPVSKSKRRPIP